MMPRVCSQDSSPAIVLVGTSQWYVIILAGRPRHGKRAPSGTGHSHELVGGKPWIGLQALPQDLRFVSHVVLRSYPARTTRGEGS